MVTTASRRPAQSPEEVAARIRSSHLRLVRSTTTARCDAGLSTSRREGYAPVLRLVPGAGAGAGAGVAARSGRNRQPLRAGSEVGPGLERDLLQLSDARAVADPSARRAAAAPPATVRRPVLRRRPVTPLRITRRGRLCLTLAAGAVLATVLVTSLLPMAQGWLAPQRGATAAAASQLQEITVLPGQTLWQIAETQRPGRDPRDVAADIRALNNLQDSRLKPGQELLLPAS